MDGPLQSIRRVFGANPVAPGGNGDKLREERTAVPAVDLFKTGVLQRTQGPAVCDAGSKVFVQIAYAG
ncbi:hypothetical protein [Actinoplanes sp. NBRC 103695]|uniref:hypothetical protein n=1 Tax=Actinoplanes sp. NBRC 103695 TaxID=3032202 RepID=UPI0025574517|nr:hypothetical protein [Actinoplanes sp. NBRC 103695]